jgi:hypothetical protein
MPLLSSISEALGEKLGPEGLKSLFYLAQVGIAVLFVGLFWKLRSTGVSQDSGFAVREADLRADKLKGAARVPGGGDLANAKIKQNVPLALEGIRIHGPPHEVLGVAPGADEAQIQKAYREKMKQYHPDKVGRPGTREWQDAQKIAEAINRAKDEMLRRRR